MDWKFIDPNMVADNVENPEDLTWYDPAEAPFEVRGLYWFNEEKKYQRFKEKDFEVLKEKAYGASLLARNPAGGQVYFETDADRIVVAAKLSAPHDMDHFAATGEMGMDCYLAYPGENYHAEGVTRFDKTKDHYVCEIIKERGREHKRVLLNLPIYKGLEALSIGLPKDAKVYAPAPFSSSQPIIFYGTSITQGGCASRPGMAYTNILSRKMDREVLNFGFSGSGRGETVVAEYIARVEDPAIYMLCYEANAGGGIMEATLRDFIDILREKHPLTPICVVSRILAQFELHVPEKQESRNRLREFQRNEVERRAAAGDENIYFLDGTTLFYEAGDECTVDGNHPTDLGFYEIAKSLQPKIEAMIKA